MWFRFYITLVIGFQKKRHGSINWCAPFFINAKMERFKIWKLLFTKIFPETRPHFQDNQFLKSAPSRILMIRETRCSTICETLKIEFQHFPKWTNCSLHNLQNVNIAFPNFPKRTNCNFQNFRHVQNYNFHNFRHVKRCKVQAVQGNKIYKFALPLKIRNRKTKKS